MALQLVDWVSLACGILALLLLYYVYDGYLRMLQLLSLLRPRFQSDQSSGSPVPLPSITVLLTVFNESYAINAKLDNLLSLNYPPEQLQVLVASDGSTDGTDDLVRARSSRCVCLIRSEGRLGKSLVQNMAVQHAKGEILVFTDAETQFEGNFLKEIASCFLDKTVGAVDGRLIMQKVENSTVGRDQAKYWAYEDKVRSTESQLGILAVSSGACLAIRRNLFKPLPADVGEDCIVPLDVILQGYRIVRAVDALAYETTDQSVKRELKRRIRMTLRNWQGTWSRASLLNPLKYPGYAWSLWSHKILRWLSPIQLLVLLTTFCVLAIRNVIPPTASLVAATMIFLASLAGYLSSALGRRVTLATAWFNFLVANLGFLLGTALALFRRRVTIYKS